MSVLVGKRTLVLRRRMSAYDPTSPLENCNELVARAADLGVVKLNYQTGI
jgi:hypothetical protein